jgi:hypothetical protein
VLRVLSSFPNSVLLDLRFPLTVYKKLLNRPLGLEELAEVDPSVAQSMRRLLEYKADDIEVCPATARLCVTLLRRFTVIRVPPGCVLPHLYCVV